MIKAYIGNMDKKTEKGYKLRVYLDAIKDLDATSDMEWLSGWICNGQGGPYISRKSFRAYLEAYVVIEAKNLLKRKYENPTN